MIGCLREMAAASRPAGTEKPMSRTQTRSLHIGHRVQCTLMGPSVGRDSQPLSGMAPLSYSAIHNACIPTALPL